MNEAEYLAKAQETLSLIADMVESADRDQLFDVDVDQTMVTITTPSSKQFVINKHLPTFQIWVSSPVRGGAHFGFDFQTQNWIDNNGFELFKFIIDDLTEFGLHF